MCIMWDLEAEDEKEYFVIKEKCKGCKGRICERCIPLANRINKSGNLVDMECNDCRRTKGKEDEEGRELDSGIQGDNENTFELIERDRTFEKLLRTAADERENDRRHARNMEEHTRLRRLYDSVIEYTNMANTEEDE